VVVTVQVAEPTQRSVGNASTGLFNNADAPMASAASIAIRRYRDMTIPSIRRWIAVVRAGRTQAGSVI
jgi:hypothetical protein